jgi:homoserine dehydrogenase
MRIQLIGLGNVGKNLVMLINEKQGFLSSLGIPLQVASVSDSNGTAHSNNGLDLNEILNRKEDNWKSFSKYKTGYSALDAIKNIPSDAVVELTPSNPSGEPGLTHIKIALECKKNVVTANKTPLVLAYEDLLHMAKKNHVRLLFEATVAAHLPVFCLIESCFKADKLVRIEGILNATTNFIIGEIESGRSFQEALTHAIEEGWAETNYSDDVNGVDSARKVVILANAFFKKGAKLKDVKIKGIRDVGKSIEHAKRLQKRVKLICGISWKGTNLEMYVAPRLIGKDDPLATVNAGKMAMKLIFQTSQEVFVSAQFAGVKQTAYAVLNDLIKVAQLNQAS